ncbi:MAG TPA: hypothetical protein VN823_20500 [Stellaceae bacterium]|nr:hypothetical protein [Stellaceae bacterium]
MDQRSAEGTAGFPFLPGFSGATMQWAVWPMQLWLQWQADMLKAVAPTTTDWMKRRREGTEAALHAFEQLCACHNVAEASKVQNEWFEDEAKRLESDMRALSNSALLFSQETTKTSRAAAHTDRAAA